MHILCIYVYMWIYYYIGLVVGCHMHVLRSFVSTVWRKFLTVENFDESGLGKV